MVVVVVWIVLNLLLLRMMLVVMMMDGWSRKFLSLSLIRAATHKHHRPIIILLLHQGRVLEALEHGRLALDTSVGNITDLVTVEYLPLLAVVLTMKRCNVLKVDKVHKCVSTVATVLEINGQVKEVHLVRSVASLGKFVQEHLLSVFVGNISHHERGPCVLSALDGVNIKQ